MPETKTRPLIEGALLAAMAVALILIGFYVPILGAVIIFLWPVPIIIIQMRHGLRIGIMTVVVAGLLLMTFVGPLQALTILLTTGTIGLAFGYGFGRRWPSGRVMVLGAVAVLVSLAASFVLSLVVLDINIITDTVETMRRSMEMSVGFYRSIGVEGEALERMEGAVDQMTQVLSLLLPAGFLLGAVFNAFINYQVSRLVLIRLGYDIPQLPPFVEWRLPTPTVGGLIVVYIFWFLFQRTGLGLYEKLAINLFYLFGTLFLVQGLALGYYLLTRWGVAKPLKVALVIWALMVPFVTQIITWVGLFDIVLDFRSMLESRQRT